MASTPYFTFFHCYLLVVPFLVGSFSRHNGVHSTHLLFYVISWREKAKWIKTAGVYSIGFEVPTHREEMGDPLEMYSVNCDISPISHFL